MSAYLDASVVLPAIKEEEASDAVDRFLSDWPGAIVVSDFAAAEVASALSRFVRMGHLDDVEAAEFLAKFDAFRAQTSSPCDLHAGDARLASTYVRRFDLMLKAPDALHAAICRRLDLTLVTLDRRLARAAGELGLSVLVPEG
ncbi:MAG TPA: type II toxin-antitoxin system VapC family toxin [Acetobacteraceae bacterium]